MFYHRVRNHRYRIVTIGRRLPLDTHPLPPYYGYMDNNEALTQVTNLKPGDVITFGSHTGDKAITVRTVAPYGDAETILTDLDGSTYILANTNWF
jgi:hypothetical protein